MQNSMSDSEHTFKHIENLYSKGDFLGVIKKSSKNIIKQKEDVQKKITKEENKFINNKNNLFIN